MTELIRDHARREASAPGCPRLSGLRVRPRAAHATGETGVRAVVESRHVADQRHALCYSVYRVAVCNNDPGRNPLAPPSRRVPFCPHQDDSMGPRRWSAPARIYIGYSSSASRHRVPSHGSFRRYAARIHRWHPSPFELRQRAYRDTAYRTPPSLVRAECAPLAAPAWIV